MEDVVSPPLRRHPLKDVRVSLLGRAPLERASSVPDNSSASVALLGRRSMKKTSGKAADRAAVQEEEALGANASVFGRLRTSLESLYRVASGSSINISRKSYERLMGTESEMSAAAAAAAVASHGQTCDVCNPAPVSQPPPLPSNFAPTHPPPPPHAPSVPTNEKLTIRIDENNIPQIDVAITPPGEDHVTNRRRPVGVAGALPRGGLSLGLRTGASGHRRNRPQFTSMKVRRHRCDPVRRVDDYEDDLIYDESQGMFVSNPTVHCPTLTITMDVDDDESLVSDYISPSPYFGYRGAGVATGDGVVGSQCPNLGDDISLYGTPKEELSPFKDVDGSRSSPSNYLKDQIISFFQPSDNKLAMKLFGNKNALMKEKLRQKAAGNWVIHPCSNFR